MGESSRKSTMTTREIYQLSHFKSQANADLSQLQKVWVLTEYGILRGKVYDIKRAFPATAYISLENGKVVCACMNDENDWIKERRP